MLRLEDKMGVSSKLCYTYRVAVLGPLPNLLDCDYNVPGVGLRRREASHSSGTWHPGGSPGKKKKVESRELNVQRAKGPPPVLPDCCAFRNQVSTGGHRFLAPASSGRQEKLSERLGWRRPRPNTTPWGAMQPASASISSEWLFGAPHPRRATLRTCQLASGLQVKPFSHCIVN